VLAEPGMLGWPVAEEPKPVLFGSLPRTIATTIPTIIRSATTAPSPARILLPLPRARVAGCGGAPVGSDAIEGATGPAGDSASSVPQLLQNLAPC